MTLALTVALHASLIVPWYEPHLIARRLERPRPLMVGRLDRLAQGGEVEPLVGTKAGAVLD